MYKLYSIFLSFNWNDFKSLVNIHNLIQNISKLLLLLAPQLVVF